MTRAMVVAALLLGSGCATSEPEIVPAPDEPTVAPPLATVRVDIAAAAFQPFGARGHRAQYPGKPGDRIQAVTAQINCGADAPAVMLCVWSSDSPGSANEQILEECTWRGCSIGETIMLTTPSTFIAREPSPIIAGEQTTISILCDGSSAALVTTAAVTAERP